MAGNPPALEVIDTAQPEVFPTRVNVKGPLEMIAPFGIVASLPDTLIEPMQIVPGVATKYCPGGE